MLEAQMLLGEMPDQLPNTKCGVLLLFAGQYVVGGGPSPGAGAGRWDHRARASIRASTWVV